MSSFDQNILGQFDGQTDVGSVNYPGTCVYDVEHQLYTIAGAGASLWGEQDDFHFVWKRLTGNFIVTMRAAWLGPSINPQRLFGWMARLSLDTRSPNVCAGIYADGQPMLQFRRAPGGQTEVVRSALIGADVIQLERKGDTYSLSAAQYGQPFVPVESTTIDLGAELYVGLLVCAHAADRLEQAVCSDVRLVIPVAEDFHYGQTSLASHLEILDLASGQRQIVYSRDDIFEAPNWTRDGQALIYNSGGRLYRFDLATRTPSLIDTGDVIRNNNDHVISFDGDWLAISSNQDNHSLIYTVPVTGGQPKLVTPTGPSYLHGWSPDGKFLVYTAQRQGDYDIYRISVEGGEETQLTTAIGLDDGPEYTPDGRYIYFNSVRTGRMQIWRMKPDGSEQEQLTDDEYNNWFPHISHDGKSVVFISYLVNEVEPSDHPPAKRVYLRLMPLDGGVPKVVAYLYGGQGTLNVPSWSPDGKRLAFVSNTVPAT